MTETYVSYAPGSWTLVARGGRYLLVEAAPTDQPVNQLWAALESSVEVATVLATIASAVPQAAFCLVEVSGTGVVLAQRGVNALLDGRPVEADGTPTQLSIPTTGGMIMAAGPAGAGSTQFPIEGGVVPAGALIVVQVGVEEAGAEPSPDLDDLPVKVPEDLPDVPAAELTDLPPAATTNLWDDVPEFDEATAEEVPGPVAPAVIDTGDAITAPPPQVPAPRSATPLDQAVTGATVLAGYCLKGHVSGAYAPQCRVCGEPMPDQTPRTVPRPSLGVLVLESGDTFDLETGAILGRAPRVPEDALETPLLVNLAAYGRDVSRQHAEVIVHGWNVFVRDLGSANGTRIREASGQVTTLEPNVAVPLAADSVLEIAEVTTIRYRTA